MFLPVFEYLEELKVRGLPDDLPVNVYLMWDRYGTDDHPMRIPKFQGVSSRWVWLDEEGNLYLNTTQIVKNNGVDDDSRIQRSS